jgi:P pilus assembly chaperone PapD
LIGALPATAQISVEVSPLRVELQAGPGSSSTQAVTLNNSSPEAVRIRARVTDWDLSRDGAPQFEGAKESGPFSATSWVRVAPPNRLWIPARKALSASR